MIPAMAAVTLYGEGVAATRGSEQRVNERRKPGARKEDERAEQKQHDHDGDEPPFLVLTKEVPKFSEESPVLLFGGGFLKLVLWLAHG